MNSPSKKILVIGFHFPPSAEVGAIRTQKFVKYLPEFGWTPHVLSIGEAFISRRDDKRLEDVKEAAVTRTSVWRTPLQMALELRNKLGRNKKAQATSAASAQTLFYESKPTPFIKRLLFSLNWLPDDKMCWIIPAVIAGYRTIKQQQIKHIYVSAPPHSTAVVGYLLSLLTGARLVIDFRDPWLIDYCKRPEQLRTSITDWMHRILEGLVVRRAEVVINVSDRLSSALRAAHPDEQADKFQTITNGFDAEDFKALTSIKPSTDKFVISYLGTFYLHRSPDLFLRAIKSLIETGFFAPDQIEIRFIGWVATAKGVAVETLIAENGLEECVKVIGTVPYADALKFMAESHALLLLAQQQYYGIPAKAFDYLAVGKPILALTSQGDTADIITQLNAGKVADPYDAKEIAEAIKQLYREASGQRTEQCWERPDVSGYARRDLARR
ncbi:MAG: glycosyltransferase, partial [Desulfuromonadales bacterium]|nr:glycosyltransferase [Desulfuromonadales bacterium]